MKSCARILRICVIIHKKLVTIPSIISNIIWIPFKFKKYHIYHLSIFLNTKIPLFKSISFRVKENRIFLNLVCSQMYFTFLSSYITNFFFNIIITSPLDLLPPTYPTTSPSYLQDEEWDRLVEWDRRDWSVFFYLFIKILHSLGFKSTTF